MADLAIDQGDDEIIDITAKQPDGSTPLNLTSVKLWFCVKRHETDDDADAVIFKTTDDAITITDALNGLAEVALANADTSGLTAADTKRTLWWALQAKDGAGKITTLARGSIVIKPDLILATS